MDYSIATGQRATRMPRLSKNALVMRAFLLVFCFASFYTAQAWAQSVNLSYRNAKVETVIKDISLQSGLQFAFTRSSVRGSLPVTINVKGMDAFKALDSVLYNQPFAYRISGKTIILYDKPAPPSTAPVQDTTRILLQGVVRDSTGQVMPGVNVLLKGSAVMTQTDSQGHFELTTGQRPPHRLIFSMVGYERLELPAAGGRDIAVQMRVQASDLEEVVVPFNTGYYSLPAERATGSFSYVDQKLINRSTSSNIIARLDGITNGVLTNSQVTSGNSKYGITVRGQATFSAQVNKDVLVVVNGFPFEGDINSINPNDVASVTVLKDAAAASIWGARSGNGVVVITTKNGSFNRKLAVEFNASVTMLPKPDLAYDKKYATSGNYIEIERYLFDQGYYNQRLADKRFFPFVTPAVELLSRYRNGEVSQSALDNSLDSLGRRDLRSQAGDEFYRPSVIQQYAANFSGGSGNISYYLGLGYDRNADNVDRNHNDRFTITSINTFAPIKRLELTAAMIYSLSNVETNNGFGWGPSTGSINQLYSYAALRDDAGNPAAINFGNRNFFLDSLERLGFQNWRYRPLQEIELADNSQKTSSMTLRATAKYSFTGALNLQVNFQTERQRTDGRFFQDPETYAVRNMVNRFSKYNAANGQFTYPFPQGGILRNAYGDLVSNNLRAQLTYARTFGEHAINALAGGEIRQTKTTSYDRLSYGYSEDYGSATNIIDYVTIFPNNGAQPAAIPAPPGLTLGTTQRFISWYGNVAYSYARKYTLTISGRQDGANMFGVKANDRITPLWSAGASYEISEEPFYRVQWLPYLKFRATYGYNGNVYSGAAYLTARLGSPAVATNLPYGTVTTAPNPELRWERVRNINFGADFGFRNNFLRGSLEYYIKNGVDLVQDMELAPSSGFQSYRANSASSNTRGIELMLTSNNLKGALRWSTTFIFNYNADKVRDLQMPLLASTLVQSPSGYLYRGNYIAGMYSYRMAGIDPANGDPIGFLKKTESKDYAAIITQSTVEDLIYHGSARPLFYGALRNNFTYKGFSLSANVTFKMKYYFRRPTVSLNYQSLLSGGYHEDYERRWTKPGDELASHVPSIQYTNNDARNQLYRYSQYTIEKGDHIRLNDIALSYDVPMSPNKRSPFKSLSVYGYINNVGIIWKANNAGMDPDVVSDYQLPRPRSFSLGVRTNF